MFLRFYLFLIASLFLQPLLAQEPMRWYVSPSGSDAAAGTSPEAPFASIERAQRAVREWKKAGSDNKSAVVSLRSGVYQLEKPLRFTDEDSGSDQFSITYQAFPGEKAVISGGHALKGWKKYKPNIWETRVPKGWSFRQLYVNGALQQRARIPNQGFLRVAGFPDGGPEVPYETPSQRFEFKPGDLETNWTNLKDIEVIVYHFWTDSHLPIQSIDAAKRIVTFRHKAGKVFTNDFTKEGARYVVENVWEGLDAPGEWYLNKQTGRLYYYALPGQDPNQLEIMAPFAPELLRVEGKPLEGKPVAYLVFKDLTFQYTNWELPPGNSNDAQGSASVPACITFSGTQHCRLENCRVENTGTFALDLIDGCQYNQVLNGEFGHLGGGGVRLNGGTEKDHPLLRTSHNVIADTRIHHYGEVFPSAVGLLLMHAHDNQLVHNEIHHGHYTGISVGWVWGYLRSVSNHNRIEYNHVHHIGMEGLLSDMGGIYTLGLSPGTVLRNNMIHDVNANAYGGWGIYLDEGSSHILVENNIVYHTKFAPFNMHFSKEVTVRNNIFALGKLEQVNRSKLDPHKSVFFENNIVYWQEGILFNNRWDEKPYRFYKSAMADSITTLTSNADLDYNLYYNPKVPLDSVSFSKQSFSEWQKRGKDVHSRYADPLFVDIALLDFRLQPNSPALQLGFRPIDQSKIGVRKREEVE